MDVVGLKITDLILDRQQYREIYPEGPQKVRSTRAIPLSDADGRVISCEIEARVDINYPEFIILRIVPD